MGKIWILDDEPLLETASTLSLDIFSEQEDEDERRARGEGVSGKKDLVGKITLNPARCRIFSLPSTGIASLKARTPESKLWDMYLIILPFTLHEPRSGSYYEQVTLFVDIEDSEITAFDLFPKDITTAVEGGHAYTITPQCTIGPVKEESGQSGPQIRFTSLRPTIHAFGEGENIFYWTYERFQGQRGVEKGIKYALVVLQVPHQTSLVEATINCEAVMAEEVSGGRRYKDGETGFFPIRWDLSQAIPFYGPESEQEQTFKEVSELFDICVTCALAEEARAFMQEVSLRCKVQFERAFDRRLDLEYYHTRIMNMQDEMLTLQVSWLPKYGPTEAILHLQALFETFKPRFAAMTGICAGDKNRVKLGDLVVADRAYFYDGGKFSVDQNGKQEQKHDADIYRVKDKVRSFIQIFDNWKSLPGAQGLEHYIGALASGSAVRGDNVFERIQFPLRTTLAIDMEAAAFYRTAEKFPGMGALVVKGVSDYADGEKDDSYHWRAETFSALYMLAFIQEFVTTERMPREAS